MEFATLNTGARMPMEGFGVYQITDLDVCEKSVYEAIKAGYRLLDTAAAYGNESALGKAVKRALSLTASSREKTSSSRRKFGCRTCTRQATPTHP